MHALAWTIVICRTALAVLALASCSPSDSGNTSQAVPAPTLEQSALVRLSWDGSSCHASWSGAPTWDEHAVRSAGLLEAAVAHLQLAVPRDPAAYVRSAVTVRLHAQGDTPYRCVGAVISTLQRAGFLIVRLEQEEAGGADLAEPIVVSFPWAGVIEETDKGTNHVNIRSDGTLLFNGGVIDAGRLRRELERPVQQDWQPILELRPAAETPYSRFLSILVMFRQAGVRLNDSDDRGPADLRLPTVDQFAHTLDQ